MQQLSDFYLLFPGNTYKNVVICKAVASGINYFLWLLPNFYQTALITLDRRIKWNHLQKIIMPDFDKILCV